MAEPTLFDMVPAELPAAEPVPKLSADAKRTIRQREAITACETYEAKEACV